MLTPNSWLKSWSAAAPPDQQIRTAANARSRGNLAHAAIAPRCATTADRASDCTGTDRAGTDRAATAGTDPAATTATGRTAAATTAPAIGDLHAAAYIFLIEEMERGETDVGHFLFA